MCSCIAAIWISRTSLFDRGRSNIIRFPNFNFPICFFSASDASSKLWQISRTPRNLCFLGCGLGFDAWTCFVVLLISVGYYKAKLGVTTEASDTSPELFYYYSKLGCKILLDYLKDTTPWLIFSIPTLKFILQLFIFASVSNCAINSLSIALTVISSVKQTLATELALKQIIGALKTFNKSF